MKKAFVILMAFLQLSTYGQDMFFPQGFEKLAEKSGDLDGDGIDEKVIVYNTTDTTEDGIVRELRIFKLEKNNWIVWKKSRNAILKSQEGGMMGDPFGEIEINKGILTISFLGGSSWKWSYKDKYRFQNEEFKLIGYSSIYGKPCEYWADLDINFSTGKVVYKKEPDKCEDSQEISKKENEVFYIKGISLNIDNRNATDHKIISPKHKFELYY